MQDDHPLIAAAKAGDLPRLTELLAAEPTTGDTLAVATDHGLSTTGSCVPFGSAESRPATGAE